MYLSYLGWGIFVGNGMTTYIIYSICIELIKNVNIWLIWVLSDVCLELQENGLLIKLVGKEKEKSHIHYTILIQHQWYYFINLSYNFMCMQFISLRENFGKGNGFQRKEK